MKSNRQIWAERHKAGLTKKEVVQQGMVSVFKSEVEINDERIEKQEKKVTKSAMLKNETAKEVAEVEATKETAEAETAETEAVVKVPVSKKSDK